MWQAEILSPWADSRVPQVVTDYHPSRCSDVTGQPSECITPDPNLVEVWIECDTATMTRIETDEVYYVLWATEDADEMVMAQKQEPKPNPATAKGKDNPASAKAFGELVAWLARQGASQAQIREAVGQHVASRTNGQIAEDVRAWLCALPRRKEDA